MYESKSVERAGQRKMQIYNKKGLAMITKTPIYLVRNASNADVGRAIYVKKGARTLVGKSKSELG